MVSLNPWFNWILVHRATALNGAHQTQEMRDSSECAMRSDLTVAINRLIHLDTSMTHEWDCHSIDSSVSLSSTTGYLLVPLMEITVDISSLEGGSPRLYKRPSSSVERYLLRDSCEAPATEHV